MIPPAQLYIGPQRVTVHRVKQELRRWWCAQQGACAPCLTCQAVEKEAYYSLLWLKPEKQSYSKVRVDEALGLLTFKLEHEQRYAIVFEQAEVITMAAAQSLLKSLEEPRPGYFFFLLVEQQELLLPTIVSRCVIYQIEGEIDQSDKSNTIINILLHAHEHSPELFVKELEKSGLAEHHLPLVFDRLLCALQQMCKRAFEMGDLQAFYLYQKRSDCLVSFYKRAPLPGSLKLCLKTLFGLLWLIK